MSVVGTVGAILRQKGNTVWSISPEATVFDAIKLMADKNIGAVVVMADDKLVGVLSEREYTRNVVLQGKSSKQTQVREIMLSPVEPVTPNHTVEECMHIMTDKRIRHLPLLEGDQVVGIVSIGDLVNWIISTQSVTIDHLENYITGKYSD